jgi:hypothetical protein
VAPIHLITPGKIRQRIFNKGWIDGVDKVWVPGKKSAEATA